MMLLKLLLLIRAHGRQHQSPSIFFRQRLITNWINLAVYFDTERSARGNKSIRRTFLHNPLQQVLNNHTGMLPCEFSLRPDLEILRHSGFFARRFPGNGSLGDHFLKALIHCLHTQGASGLNGGIHLRHFVFPNKISDR